jgi:periplasmic divalent cation tolerance protein
MKIKFIIVETTYPNLAKAKKLAEILLHKKLAACVEFLPLKSMYFWQGKLENSAEILVKIKSKNSLYNEIEKTIKDHHVYEIPQIISTEIIQGLEPYLNWVDSSTKSKK